jgi:hypothetical protein
MANIKITDLDAYADPDSTDVLPIVDVGADETKKVSIADLMENAGAGAEATPGIAFDGDPDTGIYRPGADQIAISTGGTQRLAISDTGAVTIPGNLTVQGTTTFIDSQTLQVEDKNIEMGVVTTPTDSTADGGGITLKGATDKTINWVNATDAWTSSERFSVPLGAQGTPSLTFTGDANTGIYSPGADQVAISTGGSGRLFVDANGRVGIGDSTPRAPLSVQSSSSTAEAAAFYADSTYNTAEINTFANNQTTLWSRTQINSTGTAIETVNASSRLKLGGVDNIQLFAGGSERLRIDSSGRVGIGTSSPGSKLDVVSGTAYSDIGIRSTGGFAVRGDGRVDVGAASGANALLAVQRPSGSGVSILGYFYDTINTTGVQIKSGGSNLAELSLIGSTGKLNFGNTNSSNQVTLDTATGRLGVGTTSPDFKLDVAGEIGITEGQRLSWHDGSGGRSASIFGSAGDALAFTTTGSNAEAMRIDSSGRVGVGTSSPGAALDIDSSSSTGLKLRVASNTQNKYISIANAAGTVGWTFGNGILSAAKQFVLYDNDAGAARILVNSSGNVGVGTTSPGANLEVSDTSDSVLQVTATDASTAYFKLKANGTDELQFYSNQFVGGDITVRSNKFLRFGTNSTERLRIDSSGRVGIGTSSLNTKFDVAGSSQTYTSAPAITFTDTGSGQGDANRWIAGNLAVNNYGDFALAVAPDTTSTSFSPKIAVTEAGNVGIGITNPGNFSTAANKLVIGDTSSNAGMTIRTSNTSSGNIWFADADTGAGGYRGYIGYSHATNSFTFGTNASDRLTIDSSGRLLVGTSSVPTSINSTRLFAVENPSGYVTAVFAANENSPNGAYLALQKSRGTSANSNTIVQNGDELGAIQFIGADGTASRRQAANIKAVVDGTPGSGDMPGRLVFSTTANSASSPTERMRLNSSGYLKVAYDGNYKSSTAAYHEFTGDAANSYDLRIFNDKATPLSQYILDLRFNSSTPNNGNARFIDARDSTAGRFYVLSNGGIGNYQSNDSNLCDEREKKNIETLDSTWSCLKNWDLKKFHYNEDADTDDKRYGVIAQQVAPHCPEVITDWVKQRAEEAVLDDDGNVVTPAKEEIVRMGVKEQQMMWMAIKALQEAQTRIETLEAEVAALKGA